jgi:hypothetical protein
MKGKLRWLALAGSVFVAVSGVATFAVGVRSEETARGALESALELRRARLGLAASQKEMGRSDLSGAIAGAEKANASAERVALLTDHIARMVTEAETIIGDINGSSRGSATALGSTAKQTDVVADILGAISGYQGAATRSADVTNEALERILAALRATNENFPGRDQEQRRPSR